MTFQSKIFINSNYSSLVIIFYYSVYINDFLNATQLISNMYVQVGRLIKFFYNLMN